MDEWIFEGWKKNKKKKKKLEKRVRGSPEHARYCFVRCCLLLRTKQDLLVKTQFASVCVFFLERFQISYSLFLCVNSQFHSISTLVAFFYMCLIKRTREQRGEGKANKKDEVVWLEKKGEKSFRTQFSLVKIKWD